MPYYGSPDLDIQYTFIAVVPFDAEEPIGSGTVVHYEPGDEFPGENWGRAAHSLVEVGKAVRLATNIDNRKKGSETPATEDTDAYAQHYVDSYNVPQPSGEATASEVNQSTAPVDYPVHDGGGWYTLSNGERVRGYDAAVEAEAELA